MNLDEQGIFEVARKIDSREAREAYLQQICGGDAALKQRVRDLLKAYDGNPSFLEAPAAVLPSVMGAQESDQVEDRVIETSDETQAGESPEFERDEMLRFLEASDQAGSLGRLGHYNVLEVIGRGGMGT